jgi:nitrite reductase (NADH) large subunit
MSEPLIIIGNGMATARLVDQLATRALGRYAIAVIGEEPRLAYNRSRRHLAVRTPRRFDRQ